MRSHKGRVNSVYCKIPSKVFYIPKKIKRQNMDCVSDKQFTHGNIDAAHITFRNHMRKPGWRIGIRFHEPTASFNQIFINSVFLGQALGFSCTARGVNVKGQIMRLSCFYFGTGNFLHRLFPALHGEFEFAITVFLDKGNTLWPHHIF